MKSDGTRVETRFRLSAKRTSSIKSAGASVHSTTGIRGVRISGSNAGYTMFRGSVKSTGYPLHSPVSPSLPLPCVTVCHHVSTWLYYLKIQMRTYKRKAYHFYHTPPFHPSVRTGSWSPTHRGTLVYLSQFRCKYKPPRSVTRPFLFTLQYYIRCLPAFSTVSRQIIPRKYLAGLNTTYPRTEGCFLLNICTAAY